LPNIVVGMLKHSTPIVSLNSVKWLVYVLEVFSLWCRNRETSFFKCSSVFSRRFHGL